MAILVAVGLLALAGILLVGGLVRAEIGVDVPGANKPGENDRVPDAIRQGGPVVDATGDQPRSTFLPDNTVLLTFDDGPDPRWTPKILEELRRERVPGMFFVVGSAAVRHPELLREIRRSGSELGVHTFTHPDLGRVPRWRAQMELSEAQLVLAGATGVTSTVLRPPYSAGVDSIDNVSWSVLADAGRHGYLTMLIQQDSQDWRLPGISKIIENATPRDNQGRIILMHDAGGDRSQTVAALGPLIRGLKARGVRFITASEATRAATVNPAAESGVRWRGLALLWAVQLSDIALDAFAVFLATVGVLTASRLILMLLVARRHARQRNAPRFRWGPPVRTPVSVIVPAYNEEKCIAATVRSLRDSRYPDLEVIVVDDGSTDGTADAVERLGLSGVTVLRKENGGKSSALNAGIAVARHDLILMVDADTVFESDAVEMLVQPFADSRVGAVAGNVKVANQRRLLGRWQHVEYVIGFNIDRRVYDSLRCMPTISGAIGAFRREVLEQVGGVSHTTLAEDTDLTIAVCRTGWRIVYEETARAWTEAPQSLGQLWRQRYRWSYGTMQAMWKHRRSIVEPGASGRFGRRALLVLALFQILLPTLAPLVDVFLLYGLAFLDPVRTAAFWFGVLALQVASGWYAFRLDRERLTPLVSLPLQQFVYRQLMYLVIIQALSAALAGIRLRWQKIERIGGNVGARDRRAAAAQLVGQDPGSEARTG
jgi:cellulose synthase/poly-beta-1,6-N-acetylglucosamine synthase-like glycosyltransferase/peptidoglycan/xylan/chitin deacetylase (PgdA/CDA1 family)